MTVSLYVRVVVKGKRRYVPVNKKKLYPDGTVFCLRYSRRWETLPTDDLSTALAARALKEAALLTEQPSAADAPAKRVGIDDAIAVYLSNTAATRKHRTLLAYTLATSDFRKVCPEKGWLDQIVKGDLTAYVVSLKKSGQDDHTIANRLGNVVTFLRARGFTNVTLRHKYTEKKVKAYSVEEIRALNAASTDEELQIWQFFLGTGFREEEVSHACDTDVDLRQKSISVLEKYTEKILYRPHVTLKARFKARIVW
jgi:hypothetical protein